MATQIRAADIDADERLIVEFLERNHSVDPNPKRFDWLYRGGPAGPARVWISGDSESQQVIGVAAAFPRHLYIDGRVETGWVLGDFCIADKYRSLGPALQLQRACLEGLGGVFYDFPSATMVAVYRRLGMDAGQRVARLVKPLKVNRHVDELIKVRPLANALSSVLNTGLAFGDSKLRLRSRDKVTLLEGDCEDEFSRLAESIGSALGICLQRSREYLNWRYRQHPYRRYDIVMMHRRAALIGYAVITEEEHHLSVVDIFGVQEALAELMQAVISMARQKALDSVTTALIVSHPLAAIFRRMGLRRRETYPLIIQDPYNHAGQADHRWYLTNGDRES